MKTTQYNPSTLEVSFAEALEDLKEVIQKKLPNNDIIKIENTISADNPMVKFFLLDNDGDPHEIVLKIIQTPDKF
ncbi:hypothetical protein FNH22_15450 [Fulvivirga sp. M361]|uniref:hypothetical protein n=1 Tax=Fulvivirga sp. M361 TaxID=2594266 RepID=UPI00117B5DE7|nr:hypothetical protein [Fulvivirga sp. M361]TRX57538.1 hypothetical protein FNH22_15450 [Fulvivirga sp. M361]